MNLLPDESATEIYTAEQVRMLDKVAIEALRIPGYELMCRAGEAALGALQQHWPQARTLAVLCGAGNNAGDGYVVARLANRRGFRARVIAVVPPERLSGDAAHAWKECQSDGLDAEAFVQDTVLTEDVIVDGLLGTGLDRDLTGDFLAAVTAINRANRPVLALDVPTGLHADTGLALGAAVQADVTVTFVGLKQGLFLGAAPDYTGSLEFSDLAIPPEACEGVEAGLERLTSQAIEQALPRRRPTTHKGSNGSLLLVGGAPGMAGAIRLAAEAALRAGAGLVRVATHPESVASVMAGRAEVMCQGVSDPAELLPLLGSSDAVVLGPGLGHSAWAKGLWEAVLASELPLVVDADGLNLLAGDPRDRGGWILTPHPGEAARLLQTEIAAIQGDRLAAVTELAQRYQGVVVLKGAGSLVAVANEARVGLCDRGNPGMATAGMGDVLAGILGAVLVQTGGLGETARAGVLIHAAAGDNAARPGERGMMAGDLMPHIRRWVNPA